MLAAPVTIPACCATPACSRGRWWACRCCIRGSATLAQEIRAGRFPARAGMPGRDGSPDPGVRRVLYCIWLTRTMGGRRPRQLPVADDVPGAMNASAWATTASVASGGILMLMVAAACCRGCCRQESAWRCWWRSQLAVAPIFDVRANSRLAGRSCSRCSRRVLRLRVRHQPGRAAAIAGARGQPAECRNCAPPARCWPKARGSTNAPASRANCTTCWPPPDALSLNLEVAGHLSDGAPRAHQPGAHAGAAAADDVREGGQPAARRRRSTSAAALRRWPENAQGSRSHGHSAPADGRGSLTRAHPAALHQEAIIQMRCAMPALVCELGRRTATAAR